MSEAKDLTHSNLTLSQASLDRFTEFEGKCSHFYLDGPGNVTIGIGCMLPTVEDALRLSFCHKGRDSHAVDSEVIDEFKTVKYSLPNKLPSYYDSITHLYLPETSIITLFYYRLADARTVLARQIPEFEELPDAVQEVVLDMAFNLGTYGLLSKFPKFISLIRSRKFAAAAEESERKGIQPARNNWVKEVLIKQ